MEGIRVIDVSRVLAGPTVTRLTAELGVMAMKVETATGDPSRAWPNMKHGRSGYLIQQNQGKANFRLGLSTPRASRQPVIQP